MINVCKKFLGGGGLHSTYFLLLVCTMHQVSFRVLTSAVFIAQIREPPHVGQVHGEADDREEEVQFLAPSLALRHFGARARAGARVLQTVVLFDQDELHILLLHGVRFERGHRRQLVLGHHLHVHDDL